MTFVRFLYNLCFPLVFAFLLPGFLVRMLRRGNYRHKFGQRFAVYSGRVRRRLLERRGQWIWVHAVSVGEVLIALKFIERLRRETDLPVLLSTTTSTGFALANRRRTEDLEVIYNPVDLWPCARRATHLIRPRALVLVEAEVWPNITAFTKRLGAPVLLINARLSPRSESRYRRFRLLTAPLFRQLDLICTQSDADVARWIGLGVKPERILHTGSIKFDQENQAARPNPVLVERLRAEGVGTDLPVLLGGSTHDGEERILAEILLRLRERIPGLYLILVPRHFERAKAIVEALQDLPLKIARRTEEPDGRSDVLLVDTTGELQDWYRLATVVFIGKSLTATGGQNPAEAVQADKPVVFGPHMENFADFTRGILAAHGAIQVRDPEALERQLEALLTDPGRREKLTAAAASVLEPHQGAAGRSVGELLRLLDNH